MTDEGNFSPPYRPLFVTAFVDWLFSRPIPVWLIFTLTIVVLGGGQHLYAWNSGALPVGTINPDLALSSLWVITALVLWHHMTYGAGKTIDQYQPYLAMNEREFSEVRFRFTNIASGIGTILILSGTWFGIQAARADIEVAPAIQYLVPQIRFTIWILSNALFMPLGFQLLRQAQIMRSVYLRADQIDLFNLHPLFGFSQYVALGGGLVFFQSVVLPLAINPTAYGVAENLFFGVTSAMATLGVFFYSLWGVNRQLIGKKRQILTEVNSKIEAMFQRIHSAFETENYTEITGMRTMLSALQDEKAAIQVVRTWPWEPGTLSWLVSALLIPLLVTFLRDYISKLLNP